MKNTILKFFFLLFTTYAFSQAGHIMQGVGAVNMSMGGASTAQPLDISGALQWNPASISAFNDGIIKLDVGLFFSSPELSSSIPEGMMWPADAFGPGSPASPPVSGTTLDDRGVSYMPALAMVWGNESSKHTFGISAFGVSGFGVTFPQETNLPVDGTGNPNPDWNPNDSNPINFPQNLNGFGHVESDYMLLQVGFTWAYEISDKFSVGIEPTINYAALELAPNPLSPPDFPPALGGTGKGYPTSDKASAIGFGAQLGLFYDSGVGFKAGASYKTNQSFSDLEFENTYLDGSAAPDVAFKMDFPAILSLGLGYSKGDIDIALDYRFVDYENTDGFAEKGWEFGSNGFPTGAVNGFGWSTMNVISAGFQYKGIDKLPLRIGYTYSSNPIDDELAFFSIPATAIIKNAYQFGFSYEASENIAIDFVYHHGESGDATSGSMLSPLAITPSNPYGAVQGTSVSYEMTTDLIMFGLSYTFNKSTSK